jgi:hypothetical protein
LKNNQNYLLVASAAIAAIMALQTICYAQNPEFQTKHSANPDTAVHNANVFYTQKTDNAYFYYSLDGKLWTKIGKHLQMSYSLAYFVGFRFALFNYSTKTAGGFVNFDFFRISNNIEKQ